MDISGISRVGDFDRVFIRGQLEPLYKLDGITLADNQSLSGSLDTYSENKHNAIAKLHIEVVGENYVQSSNEVIAYSDILILKSLYSMMLGTEQSGRDAETIEKLVDNEYISNLFNILFDLEQKILKSNKELSEYDTTSCIVDIVYVEEKFRRFKISTWIHNNIANIVNAFALVFPNFIILEFGDTKEEADKRFNMDGETYDNMLKQHYLNVGYRPLKEAKLKTKYINAARIMVKVFDCEG